VRRPKGRKTRPTRLLKVPFLSHQLVYSILSQPVLESSTITAGIILTGIGLQTAKLHIRKLIQRVEASNYQTAQDRKLRFTLFHRSRIDRSRSTDCGRPAAIENSISGYSSMICNRPWRWFRLHMARGGRKSKHLGKQFRRRKAKRVNKLPPSPLGSGVSYISPHHYMSRSFLDESFLASGCQQARNTAADARGPRSSPPPMAAAVSLDRRTASSRVNLTT
jgi:hypothetical protein